MPACALQVNWVCANVIIMVCNHGNCIISAEPMQVVRIDGDTAFLILSTPVGAVGSALMIVGSRLELYGLLLAGTALQVGIPL